MNLADCIDGRYPIERTHRFCGEPPINPPESWWGSDDDTVDVDDLIDTPMDFLVAPKAPVTAETVQALLDESGIETDRPMDESEMEDLADAINARLGFDVDAA